MSRVMKTRLWRALWRKVCPCGRHHQGHDEDEQNNDGSAAGHHRINTGSAAVKHHIKTVHEVCRATTDTDSHSPLSREAAVVTFALQPAGTTSTSSWHSGAAGLVWNKT